MSRAALCAFGHREYCRLVLQAAKSSLPCPGSRSRAGGEGGAINFNAVFALPGAAEYLGNPDLYQHVNDHKFNYIFNEPDENRQENKFFSVKTAYEMDMATLTVTAACDGLYCADIQRTSAVGYGADFGPGCRRDIYIPPGGPNPTDLLFRDEFKTEVFAAFGQIELDVGEKGELALRNCDLNQDRANLPPEYAKLSKTPMFVWLLPEQNLVSGR